MAALAFSCVDQNHSGKATLHTSSASGHTTRRSAISIAKRARRRYRAREVLPVSLTTGSLAPQKAPAWVLRVA